MNRENLAQIKTYALGIAALLYSDFSGRLRTVAQGTVPEQLETIEV
ncbi:MAG: hypothetical protein GDA48_17745 [Hormoscilla sp. GM102CHS1]|nr:hypothetical protein [Hormoscilla sp. GM102CHS1]